MEQPPSTQDERPEPPLQPTLSLAGRMAGVIAAPSEAFDALRNSPPCVANWLVPGLLLILAGWVGAAIIFSQPALAQQFTEMMERSTEQRIEKAKMPPEQAERAREMGARMAGIMTKAGAAAWPVVMGFVVPFVWGLFIWLVGDKIFKGGLSYMKAVEVVGLANVIAVLDSVLKMLLILLLNNLFADASLKLLVIEQYDPQNPVHNLLGVVNIMTFWVLAVRSAGLARLSGISFVKAAACVFGIWFAYTGFFTGLGLAAQAIMKHAGTT